MAKLGALPDFSIPFSNADKSHSDEGSSLLNTTQDSSDSKETAPKRGDKESFSADLTTEGHRECIDSYSNSPRIEFELA